MDSYSIYAEALRYPYPGQIELLEKKISDVSSEAESRSISKYLEKVKDLDLSELEVLFTRTLDLDPMTAPYVGYQIWGESYRRGAFMARLNFEMKRLEIDKEGELPDHLVPIFRYLDATSSPMPELLEVLGKSIKAMRISLKDKDSKSPYLDLFNAIEQACKSLPEMEK